MPVQLPVQVDTLIAYGLALVILYMLVRAFIVPIRFLLQAAYRVALGGAAIWVLNWVGAFFGFHLGLNLVTAAAVGYLGAPGVLMLVALQRLAGA
ncbi:MAG: pro-sigmaK processing inhibitor BofA family protein [Thermaerobacter sp.]|nr:MAG: SigmaK-factor processing regulatory BofA [Bacillota bacterium]